MSPFEAAPIAVIDTETTGLDPAFGHAVVEVACIAMGPGAGLEPWSSLVRPGRPVPPDAAAVHGITDAMVADAPPPEAVARALRPRLEGRTLVFHNAAFDLPFLQALLRSAGEPPAWNPVVDTLGLARGLADLRQHGLQSLARHYALPLEPAHRALGDALTTARLFAVLARRWQQERGIASLAELAAASQDAIRLPRAAPR